MQNSRLVPPADNHSTVGEVNPADHGFGPLEISLPGFTTEIDSRVLNTSKTSSEFPFNLDLNGGNAVGVGKSGMLDESVSKNAEYRSRLGLVQSSIGAGQRSSSSTAYLEPNLNRPNLDVLVQNTVTRLIQTGTKGGSPAFNKVEFAPDSACTSRFTSPRIATQYRVYLIAKRSTVTANKEVILSAGALGSPQILMLSGIGDSTELQKVGIKTLVNLPDVGRNFTDHPIMSNFWNVSSNQTYDDVLRNPALLQTDLTQWENSRTGILTDAPVSGIGFLRLASNASIFQSTPDPAAGKHQ